MFAADEVTQERISINWDTDVFDMYRYTDSYLREYNYYSVDYLIKENAADSIWNTQISTVLYTAPDYIVIHEVHNYFVISHYFSNEQLTNNRTREEFYFSPYRTGGDMMQYVRRFNSMIEKINLMMIDARVISVEKRTADLDYLEDARRFMY
jgi:hypothetical protein